MEVKYQPQVSFLSWGSIFFFKQTFILIVTYLCLDVHITTGVGLQEGRFGGLVFFFHYRSPRDEARRSVVVTNGFTYQPTL